MPDSLLERRDRELARPGGRLYDDLIELAAEVSRGFEGQSKRADDILDYWDIYDCILNNHQFYNGRAQVYVPIVNIAIEARKTRFVNQIFPSSGKNIDATSSDEGVPHAEVALMEYYIRRARLKEEVEELVLHGDIEGHYWVYAGWDETRRHIVSRETREVSLGDVGVGAEVAAPDTKVEILTEETFVDAGPSIEVLHDSDVLILPPTAGSVEEALAVGGSVTILRRWTKSQVKDKAAAGEIMAKPAKWLVERAGNEEFVRSVGRALVDEAGIKDKGSFILVYEIWKNLPVGPEGEKRLCRIYYGGHEQVLSCRRNPFWNDRCPLVGRPMRKRGRGKGRSPLATLDTIQYHANDTANQAADSATYSMLPIIMSDPAKNPRTSTMILDLAAIWEVDPNSTRFAEFPKLWQDGIALIAADTQTIFQALGVNPAMLPQASGRPGAKRNQAEIAMEQQVDLLTTAVACSAIEEVLTAVLERWADYDQQFRNDEITVSSFGELGMRAKMERVSPIQVGRRLQFTWFGVEQARNAAQLQQQIAWLNVAKGMEPQLRANGYRLNPAPALEHSAGNIFGWRMGRQILVDQRSQLSLDPQAENQLLEQGFDVPVSPLDNAQEHVMAHQMALQATGDPTGMIRIHLMKHLAQMQMTQGPPMAAGAPAGGGATPPGAQPQAPRLVKGPAGMIPPESLPRAGAVVMPRKI